MGCLGLFSMPSTGNGSVNQAFRMTTATRMTKVSRPKPTKAQGSIFMLSLIGIRPQPSGHHKLASSKLEKPPGKEIVRFLITDYHERHEDARAD